MIDEREIVRRAVEALEPPEPAFERLLRRRDHKRRNQRIAAGAVGIVVFVAAIWIVTTAGPFDRSQTPVTPGGAQPSVEAPDTPHVDYVIDLDTGVMTPLPPAILGSLGRKDLGFAQPPFGPFGRYAASPDGSTLAFVAPAIDGRAQIFVANLDGSDLRQVTFDPVQARSPAWSPDGTKIGYASGRDLLVLDLASGETRRVIEGVPLFTEVQFTPDGSSLLYEGGTGEFPVLRTVPVSGGKSTLLVGRGKGLTSAANGSMSPDGSLVTYLASGLPEGRASGHCGPCRVVANVDDTERRIIAGWGSNPAGTWSPDGTRIVTNDTALYGGIIVVDVATGDFSPVSKGSYAIWLDDHTLLVEAWG